MALEILINNRDYTNFSETVLDIWFNALQEFEMFKKTKKNILKINKEHLNFLNMLVSFIII